MYLLPAFAQRDLSLLDALNDMAARTDTGARATAELMHASDAGRDD
jgi:hypothetical protein